MIRMKENWKANAKVTWAHFSSRNVSSRPISVYKEKDSLKTGLGKPRQPPAASRPLIYKLPRVAADLAEYMKQIPNRRAGVCECRRCGCEAQKFKVCLAVWKYSAAPCTACSAAVRSADNWLRMKAKVQTYLQSHRVRPRPNSTLSIYYVYLSHHCPPA